MVERPGRTPLGVAAFEWGRLGKPTDRPPRWGRTIGQRSSLAAVPASDHGRNRGDEADDQDDPAEDQRG